MKAFLRILLLSLMFILIAALLSIVHGFFSDNEWVFSNVFTWNFLLGGFFIVVGFVKLVIPVRIKDKLIDHTTFVERYLGDQHKAKQEKSYTFLYLGLQIIIITGLVQLLLSVIIPGNTHLQ